MAQTALEDILHKENGSNEEQGLSAEDTSNNNGRPLPSKTGSAGKKRKVGLLDALSAAPQLARTRSLPGD